MTRLQAGAVGLLLLAVASIVVGWGVNTVGLIHRLNESPTTQQIPDEAWQQLGRDLLALQETIADLHEAAGCN